MIPHDRKGNPLMATVFNKPVVCPVLIGRSGDLTAFHMLVDQTKRGMGQVALMSGEAGIGKSRLIAEGKTYALAQGFRLLQGNCFPGDTSCPYTPLLDLFRMYFAGQSKTEIATELRPFAREFAQLIPDLVHVLPESAPLPPLPPLEPEQEKLFSLTDTVQLHILGVVSRSLSLLAS
jgi:hypothetical protein